MANLVRIEPALFRADEAWFVFDDGRKCLRKLDGGEETARSEFPAPMVLKSFDQPVLSHADGKYYTDKRALERSYRAENNPQGVNYECVGEKVAQPFKRPKRDKAKAREAIDRTLSDMGI